MHSTQDPNVKINRPLQSSFSPTAPRFQYAPKVVVSNNKYPLSSTLYPQKLLLFSTRPLALTPTLLPRQHNMDQLIMVHPSQYPTRLSLMVRQLIHLNHPNHCLSELVTTRARVAATTNNISIVVVVSFPPCSSLVISTRTCQRTHVHVK